MQRYPNSPFRTCLAFLAADFLSLALTAWLCVMLRHALGGVFTLDLYARLFPSLFLFSGVYALMGLYPGLMLSPPEELKKMTWGTSLGLLIIGAVTFFSRDAEKYSRMIFLSTWLFSLATVPLGRVLCRRIFADSPWWGYPAVIFGSGRTAGILLSNLRMRKRIGLIPVAVMPEDAAADQAYDTSLRLLKSFDEARALAKANPQLHALIAYDDALAKEALERFDAVKGIFRKVMFVPAAFGLGSLWVTAVDVGGMLCLKAEQKLLDPTRQRIKRGLDLLVTILGGLCILPMLAVIALLVKREDGGPIFYGHKRIGHGGKEITVWKFRSMIVNADEELERRLAEDPALAEEWRTTQKLENDFRVTKIGDTLRRLSLDEFPQLYNVLKGELSLVGPRPIVEEEIPKYRESFELYTQVKPGITGLWQVSGRNALSYDTRIDLDEYYIRNWSVWFDIYIFCLTPKAVLSCRGSC